MDRITLRRHLHRIAEMRPLSFHTCTADLDVHTVSIFDDYDGTIAIALVTGTGTTTLRLLPSAAISAARDGDKLSEVLPVPVTKAMAMGPA